MRGYYAFYHDEAADVNYYACIIADATAGNRRKGNDAELKIRKKIERRSDLCYDTSAVA